MNIGTWLSPRKIGGVYVLIAMVILFSIWVPDTFPRLDTARQICNSNAITALAALALVIPLSAGVFDISIPQTMTMSGVFATYAIVYQDLPVWLAIVIAMGASLAVGLLNGLVVVVGRVDSLIGTLATGFLVSAVVNWRTEGIIISGSGLSEGFAKIAQTSRWGFTMPVLFVVILAAILWYLLEHTALGRRLYAIGFNEDAARLASIPTARLRFVSLMVSSAIAGFAGIVLASTLGSASPTGGSSYLLPAFAAVFLGATQLKAGRFNAWGTLIAVVLLGTGVTGLGLASQPQWVQNVFTGAILILSLALTSFERRQLRRGDAGHKDAPDPLDLAAEPQADATLASAERRTPLSR